jgi:hypothetical protein
MSVFPHAAILDNFNRADGDLGANWQEMMRAGNDFNIVSFQATDDGWNAEVWNPATYGPNSEVYATIATLQLQNETVLLYLRLKDIGVGLWAFDGYRVSAHRFNNAGTDTMRVDVARIDNSASTQLGASVNIPDLGNGNKVGLRARGSALEFWYDDGAGWQMRGERTDATYAAAGYLGMYLDDTSTVRIDDFGGGATAPVDVHMAWRTAYKSQDD